MTPGSTCEDLALASSPVCSAPSPRFRSGDDLSPSLACVAPASGHLVCERGSCGWTSPHPQFHTSGPRGWGGSCLCHGINQTLPHPWKPRKDPVLPSSCGQSSGRALSRSLGVRLWLGPPLISLRLSFRFREAEIRKPALTQRC